MSDPIHVLVGGAGGLKWALPMAGGRARIASGELLLERLGVGA